MFIPIIPPVIIPPVIIPPIVFDDDMEFGPWTTKDTGSVILAVSFVASFIYFALTS